ncbi:bifunctional diguanylate cyclase/phosphodiesterase [Sphingomonas colocasiae]|uniref:EAL domain-containing protein n=1 Tax=Sphingomonas colocasiae TaxID=1848973 RepID=A0ABS7PUH9_9SPHN|nr:EAL domain-containing protein [Sphingomonas colocasiae]MBY8825011.1 EAL domain-containing protein [Sphingomonas colocasiae]
MAGSDLRSVQRLMRHVPAQYLWPVLLLLVTCFGCILLLLYRTTSTQNELQLNQERAAAAGALEAAAAMTRRDLEDYAKWDEAMRNIVFTLDAEWLADNLGAYLSASQGYEHIFVLDGRDRTIYGFHGGKRVEANALSALGPQFRKSLADVRRMPVDGRPLAGGYSRADDGTVMLYAVGAIIPLTRKVVLPPGPTHMLVIARPVDDAFARAIGEQEQLSGLALHARRPAGKLAAVALPGSDGGAVGWLAWTPARPGAALRRAVFPAFLAVAALALLMAGFIVRRGGRTIEALRQSEARARHHANHDTLTGLPNRRALVAHIRDALAEGGAVGLLYMDLDGFKDANDVYGHGAGDALLRDAADRIRAAVRQGLVARAGGDEFAVLLVDPPAGEAERAADAIVAAFNRLFSVGAYRVRVGISVGHAAFSAGAVETETELMRRADVAMYAAKGDGKNCWRGYATHMDRGHDLRMRMEGDLRAALDNGDIRVLFQPIVDARSGAVVSVEALSRWTHPVHGDVPPDIFIPLAEMSGQINAVGRHVLTVACREAKPLDVSVAVNLSPAQFWDRRLADEVRGVLAETGFPADRLELEITENYLLRRPDAAAMVIAELRALGIRIALDDFGTGFASIGYLRQLSFDRLKIDRDFIRPLGQDAQAAELVSAVVSLARALGLEITAEGVETEAQAAIARIAGCTRLQGWLYGQAMDVAQLRDICSTPPSALADAADR